MSLTIFIPTKNEEKIIEKTIFFLKENLGEKFDYEILVVDDFSKDNTVSIIKKLNFNNLKLIMNHKRGLGSAVEVGISNSSKEYFCIYMADGSDSVIDIIKYYEIITGNKNLDAVFGSRFLNKSLIKDYPKFKLILNRIFNYLVKLLFLSRYNDFTNAFKIYRKKTLLNFYPIVSEHFNIFLELPLKLISRDYKYEIIPISWTGRVKGESKFNLSELGSKYIFTLIYCWLEKNLLKKK